MKISIQCSGCGKVYSFGVADDTKEYSAGCHCGTTTTWKSATAPKAPAPKVPASSVTEPDSEEEVDVSDIEIPKLSGFKKY